MNRGPIGRIWPGGMLLAVMVLSVVGSGADDRVMEDDTLRVLTFNILHGATMRGDHNLQLIADVINAAKPDLVALQEVDVKTGRVKGRDVLQELAALTDLNPAFAQAMEYDGGAYGVAVLSRFPIRSTEPLALPHTAGNEPRVALAVTVDDANGTPLRFISTHLDFSSEADRKAQARALVTAFGADTIPSVLAGDFNATPGSPTLAILEESWQDTSPDEAAPTFPSDDPVVKIDYIVVAPAEHWEVVESRVIQDKIASDHCGYLAVLKQRAPGA